MAERVATKEQRAAEIAAARDAMMRQIKETQKRALVQQDQLKARRLWSALQPGCMPHQHAASQCRSHSSMLQMSSLTLRLVAS